MELERLNSLSLSIIQAAIEIHRTLGPGLLEKIYRTCMIYELAQRGLTVVSEQVVPIRYKNLVFDGSYRLDLLVQNEIVVEIKAVEMTLPVHHAQLLSYLRLTNKQLGLLINFNVPVLVDGVKRVINGFPSASLAATRPTREEKGRANVGFLYLCLFFLVCAVGAKPTHFDPVSLCPCVRKLNSGR